MSNEPIPESLPNENLRLCEAFLKHLAECSRGICSGHLQLVVYTPENFLAFDVAMQPDLAFERASALRSGVPLLIFDISLVRRFLSQNELMSPRDYDVRRHYWLDSNDALSWSLLQSAFRPNSWAKASFQKWENQHSSGLKMTNKLATITDPSSMQILEQIDKGEPCRFTFTELDPNQRQAQLKQDALILLAEAQRKERRDRSKYLTAFDPPFDALAPSFRLEPTLNHWAKFGIPFYGMNSYACLEICEYVFGQTHLDQSWVCSALSEFRICAEGSTEVTFLPSSAAIESNRHLGFGSQQFLQSSKVLNTFKTELSPGEVLLIPPGYFHKSCCEKDRSITISHYWRYDHVMD